MNLLGPIGYRCLFIGLVVLTGLSCSEIVQPEDAAPPAVPANFTLIGGGDGEATFRWTANTEPDFDRYRVYRAVDNPVSFAKLVELRQTQYVDRFLDYTTVYYYYVVAVDFAGNESTPSPVIDVQPLNISSPPQPTNLVVSGTNNPLLGRQEINLVWFPPNISDLKNYRLFRGQTPNFPAADSTLLDSTTVSVYTDRAVQPGIFYYYRVVAVDRGFKISPAGVADGDRILNAPSLISPANQTVFSPPFVFSWAPVTQAVAYQIFLGEAPLTNILWVSGKTNETQGTYAGPPLVAGRIYYWWVVTFSRDRIVREDGTILDAPVNSTSLVNRFFVE